MAVAHVHASATREQGPRRRTHADPDARTADRRRGPGTGPFRWSLASTPIHRRTPRQEDDGRAFSASSVAASRGRGADAASASYLLRGRRQRHLGPAQIALGQQSLAGRRGEHALERGERLAGPPALGCGQPTRPDLPYLPAHAGRQLGTIPGTTAHEELAADAGTQLHQALQVAGLKARCVKSLAARRRVGRVQIEERARGASCSRGARRLAGPVRRPARFSRPERLGASARVARIPPWCALCSGSAKQAGNTGPRRVRTEQLPGADDRVRISSRTGQPLAHGSETKRGSGCARFVASCSAALRSP